MPTDTDSSAGILILMVLLTILTTIHIAYIFYHRIIWGENWTNKLSTVGMVLAYVLIFIMSLVVINLPDTSDYGVNIFFYLGTILPLFNIGMYAYSYYYFKPQQEEQEEQTNSVNKPRKSKKRRASENSNNNS